MDHTHSHNEIAKRLATPPKQSYLRDWIYGGIDGAVTTFAVVSGVVGGRLSHLVIIILGFANLIADGFSMAASNYLSTKAEHDEYAHYESIEKEHIKSYPEGEKEEIRQILQSKGMTGDHLAQTTDLICQNESLWISTMLHEEYGLPKSIRSPYKAATSTFFAFLICGFVPLIPYLFDMPQQFLFSIIATCSVFFIIGSIKARWSLVSWWRSGLQTLIIGAVVAALSYLIGYLLHIYLK